MPDEATKKYGTIVTDVGLMRTREAVMEGKKINLTTLAVGDGDGAYYVPSADMQGLKNETWRGDVSSVTVNPDSPNMIDVVAVIPSDVGGFTIREMAVLDDGEYTIAICNTPDTEKVIITSGAAGEVEVTMHIEFSNTGVITFIVDPYALTATKKDIQEHNTSPAAHEALFERKAEVTDLNAHTNNSDIHVNPTTMGNYDTAISGLIEHTEDTNIHVSAADKAAWNEAAQLAAKAAADAARSLNLAAGLESRVSRMEDGIYNDITGNPFLVSFDSLDGIVLVKGVWNEAQHRVEC